MADTHLRKLARGDQADLESEVRLLRARLRSGALSEERVRLAGMLGHVPSRLATGVARTLDVADLAIASAMFSAEAQVRVMVAAVAAVWPAAELYPEPQAVLFDYWQRVESWACCPCDACARNLAGVDEAFWILGFYECNWVFIRTCLWLAADAAVGGLPDSPLRLGERNNMRLVWNANLQEEFGPQTAADIQRQVRDEIVPWAFGGRDTVAERRMAQE